MLKFSLIEHPDTVLISRDPLSVAQSEQWNSSYTAEAVELSTQLLASNSRSSSWGKPKSDNILAYIPR